MRAPLNVTEAPAGPSPLWIIALFIALSEVMAFVAAITTDGGTQVLFAVFAVSFPFVVLGVFIYMLLNRPATLYSPWQFTEQTTVERYVEAMGVERRAEATVLKQAVSEAVIAGAAQSDSASPESVRDEVAKRFDQVVEGGTITVDRSLLIAGAEPVQIPVTEETKVNELLNSIYWSISSSVEPYTYGKSWVLLNPDEEALTDIGTEWAKGQKRRFDLRTLGEAGIKAGSTLRAARAPA